MFNNSQFNGDISNWDVFNVTDMYNMFRISQFTSDNFVKLYWYAPNLTDTNAMFNNSGI